MTCIQRVHRRKIQTISTTLSPGAFNTLFFLAQKYNPIYITTHSEMSCTERARKKPKSWAKYSQKTLKTNDNSCTYYLEYVLLVFGYTNTVYKINRMELWIIGFVEAIKDKMRKYFHLSWKMCAPKEDGKNTQRENSPLQNQDDVEKCSIQKPGHNRTFHGKVSFPATM